MTTTEPETPQLGHGIHLINNQAEHAAFLAEHSDKLIVLKVYAPWCRACKGLAPKYVQLANDDKYKDLPIVWAELSIQHNKEFVKSLGVLALPTIQFYVGESLQETFPCGPSKVSLFKRKLAQLVKDHVDATTMQVRALPAQPSTVSVPSNETVASTPPSPSLTSAERWQLRTTIPYFSEMNLADIDRVLDRAKLLPFEAGSVVIREGRPGRVFYVIRKGEVEICQQMSSDPLAQASLGSVINRLTQGQYFGERALMTGEPRAASIRASEDLELWAFDKDDFPHSSVLSGRTKKANDDLDVINDKYGVSLGSLYTDQVKKQAAEASLSNQKRGSVNRPQAIRGVDDETEIDEVVDEMENVAPSEMEKKNDVIFTMLMRFRMIRHVSRCFKYIMRTGARWGDPGIRARRNVLISRLSPAQRDEFKRTFTLIDASGDGEIQLSELKLVMDSAGESQTDQELLDLMDAGHCDVETNTCDDEVVPALAFQDYMGIMAEAEFYYLFREIFSTLDPEDTGFVQAKQLNNMLEGIRDLVSEGSTQTMAIDMDDDDMLIDYEQFSRMLLGTSLI